MHRQQDCKESVNQMHNRLAKLAVLKLKLVPMYTKVNELICQSHMFEIVVQNDYKLSM